jgi:hypothetical protein
MRHHSFNWTNHHHYTFRQSKTQTLEDKAFSAAGCRDLNDV